jgi:CubicO group peptidase (beta-lactamase class C family)
MPVASRCASRQVSRMSGTRRLLPVLASLSVMALLQACSNAAGPTDRPPPTGIDAFSRASELLAWTQAQRIAGFSRMDSIFPSHPIARGTSPRVLPTGMPLAALSDTASARSLSEFMASQGVAGVLVLKDGAIRLERYALGASPTSKWTSFSVAKSLTAMLVGAAIRDGAIAGLDANITEYIRDLRGTAYDGVTVRHLLTMTSGVAWNEDYNDPNSDIRRFTRYTPVPGLDANVGFVRTLRRDAPPGTRWVYKTPETNLLGVLVLEATGKPLATYLSEKIWGPYGMERDATWLVDHIGHEQGGCCLQATLRDFGRIGQFMLDGARVNGQSIVPAGWVDAATRTQQVTGVSGLGYGYQWWTRDGGRFEARGLYGQLIHVDPARRMVIVVVGSWADVTSGDSDRLQQLFVSSVAAAIDAEAGGG